jgi:DNA polymerase-1
MLRLACDLGVDVGVQIAAPVHDAVLITAPLGKLDGDIGKMVAAMEEASRVVLGGYQAIVEVDKVVKYPDRYVDPRGVDMWGRLMAALKKAERHGRV